MSWKAVLSGREDDPSFLLKSLVTDIEKAMEKVKQQNNPYLDDNGKPLKGLEKEAKAYSELLRTFKGLKLEKPTSLKYQRITWQQLAQMYVASQMIKDEDVTDSKGKIEDTASREIRDDLRRNIVAYYDGLIKKVKSNKLNNFELSKEWLDKNRFWNLEIIEGIGKEKGLAPKGAIKTVNEKTKKILEDLGISFSPDMFGNLTPESDWQERYILAGKDIPEKIKELQNLIKPEDIAEKKKNKLELHNKSSEKIKELDISTYKQLLFSFDTSNDSFEDLVNKYYDRFVNSIEGQIAALAELEEEKDKSRIPEGKLYSSSGGKTKFRKEVKKFNIKMLESLKKDDLQYFDEKWAILTKEADKKLKNALENKPAPVDKKNTISFMEVYGNLEGESELKELKSLLQDEEMKTFFESLKKVKYPIPKMYNDETDTYEEVKWDDLSEKQKNTWELQNKRKFQDSYQRILKNLKALKNKYSKMESSMIIRRKIDNITSVINTLAKRFNMKNWEQDKKEAEETKRERGTSLRRTGKDSQLTDEQRKEREKFELTAIYEVLFSDPELLDKGNIKSKVKSALPQSETKVAAATKSMWRNFADKLEVFSKSKNPDKDFSKFIASNELYFIDVVNLLQTKRNPKPLPKRKVVIQKPKKQKKEEIGMRRPSTFAGVKPEKPLVWNDKTKEWEEPKKKTKSNIGSGKVKKSYVPKELAALSSLFDDSPSTGKPIGSNKEAMKRRAKDIGRKHKDIMFANYKKLREQMDKIKTDDFDKYFSEAKTVMDADLFAWIDKTNTGIGLRPFSYDDSDTGFSDIEDSYKTIMKFLNKTMMYNDEETKVLDVINKLGRKIYNKQAGALVSKKKQRIADTMKEIKESTIRDIQNQKKTDFEIPRLLKLKFKQEGIKLKKYFYNIFEATDRRDGFEIDLPEFNSGKANEFIQISEKLSNELTEIEKELFDKWKKISEKLTEESKEEDEVKVKRTVGQRVGSLYIGMRELNEIEDKIYEYDELIDKTMRQIRILEVEIEAFIELFEKAQKKGFTSVATKRTLPDKEQEALAAKYNEKIQDAKRSMKRKLKLIPNFKKAIKKLDKLGEGWKKSIENIKESTRGKEE